MRIITKRFFSVYIYYRIYENIVCAYTDLMTYTLIFVCLIFVYYNFRTTLSLGFFGKFGLVEYNMHSGTVEGKYEYYTTCRYTPTWCTYNFLSSFMIYSTILYAKTYNGRKIIISTIWNNILYIIWYYMISNVPTTYIIPRWLSIQLNRIKENLQISWINT